MSRKQNPRVGLRAGTVTYSAFTYASFLTFGISQITKVNLNPATVDAYGGMLMPSSAAYCLGGLDVYVYQSRGLLLCSFFNLGNARASKVGRAKDLRPTYFMHIGQRIKEVILEKRIKQPHAPE